ncbi:unnamed protein product [Adineta steineri]|uniref:ZZ-type domain-containing protein n=1 Tax=Adineta steineri TaxID=433720 RepID=A0A813NG01_9BILA|nr:unnamed protein product [Adineta steineri]CAF0747356.1 unnamed protein product [Adineta steineri]
MDDNNLKPIFSSQSYLESLFGFCDLCLNLIDCENELFFECETCNNVIVCLGCVKHRTERLNSHPSDHHFCPGKPQSNTHWMQRNLSIVCNSCREKNFFGKHYQCRQCLNYNICSKCLSKVEHNQHHTFKYISNPIKIHNNRCLLADRALQILKFRNGKPTDRDEITGWSYLEAEIIYLDEMNNYYTAWKEASKILEDDDIDFIPSIIEHEKIALPLILI